MKSRVIPGTADPWKCEINGKKYSYPAGTTQDVCDDVASLIDDINAEKPVEAPEPGSDGQVWTRQETGAAWESVPEEIPAGGSSGHCLKRTSTGGLAWGTPYTLPSATESAKGGVKKAESIAPCAAEDVAGVNTWLASLVSKLVTAGIITEYVAPEE